MTLNDKDDARCTIFLDRRRPGISRLTLPATGCLLLTALCSFAQTAHRDGSSQAWIRKTSNGPEFVTRNTEFEYTQLLNESGTGYRHLLLRVTSEQRTREDAEGALGTVFVQAWNARQPKASKPLWTFKTSGNEVDAVSGYGFVQVITWPCCASPTNREYHSLTTGRHLYDTSEVGDSDTDRSLIQVIGRYNGNIYSGERFVAMAEDPHAENTVVIQYGSRDAVLQRLAVQGGPELNTAGDLPTLTVRSGERSEQAQQLDLDGDFTFEIDLVYAGGVEVHIPVNQDRIVLDSAALPKEFKMKLLRNGR